jgi:hypothetical protein
MEMVDCSFAPCPNAHSRRSIPKDAEMAEITERLQGKQLNGKRLSHWARSRESLEFQSRHNIHVMSTKLLLDAKLQGVGVIRDAANVLRERAERQPMLSTFCVRRVASLEGL